MVGCRKTAFYFWVSKRLCPRPLTPNKRSPKLKLPPPNKRSLFIISIFFHSYKFQKTKKNIPDGLYLPYEYISIIFHHLHFFYIPNKIHTKIDNIIPTIKIDIIFLYLHFTIFYNFFLNFFIVSDKIIIK